MKKLSIAIAAVLAAAPFAAAADSIETTEVKFSYAVDTDLLASDAAATSAYAKLVAEARQACALTGTRGIPVVDEACVADLIAKVVAEVEEAQQQQLASAE